jgi:hypothetical protein
MVGANDTIIRCMVVSPSNTSPNSFTLILKKFCLTPQTLKIFTRRELPPKNTMDPSSKYPSTWVEDTLEWEGAGKGIVEVVLL